VNGEQLDDKAVLETLRTGTKASLGQVRDGKGSLSYYTWKKSRNQQIVETNAKCISAFTGSKVRWDIEESVTIDGLPAAQIVEGVKVDTSQAKMSGLFDGEKMMIYDTRRNRADIKSPTPGEKYEWERRLPFFYGTVDIDVLLDQGTTVSVVGQEAIDNSACYKIESSITKAANGREIILKMLAWIDPAKGYLVPKKQIWAYFEGKEILTEDYVTELKEYVPGLWAPVRAVWISYRADPPDYEPYRLMEQRVVFENYAFNLNVPDADLEIKLPDGTEVYDDVLGTRLYVVGKEM
jgi:hypothetical protein